MVLLVVMMWLLTLPAGGLLTIGLITVATGRIPFTWWGQTMSQNESRQLGAVWSVVGTVYATWALVGGIGLAIERDTGGLNPVFGHWWGFLLVLIPALVMEGGLMFQLAIYNRHKRRLRERV